jgi:hypothetical protein
MLALHPFAIGPHNPVTKPICIITAPDTTTHKQDGS